MFQLKHNDNKIFVKYKSGWFYVLVHSNETLTNEGTFILLYEFLFSKPLCIY